MSLFQTLMRKAADELGDEVLTEDRFDDLAGQIEQQVDQLPNEELKTIATASLDELKAQRSNVLHMGKTGLLLFVSHIAGGNDHAAQLEYIRNSATVDDLISGMIADAGIVARAKRSEEDFKDDAISLIKAIGIKGAQMLLPLLLAAI